MQSFTSAFEPVLRTNFVPSPLDIKTIEKLLEGPCNESRMLDSQLQRIQKQLREKMLQRDGLATRIDEHRNLLTPFRCLPDDILREIFMWCLPAFHEASMACHEPPLLLGYVCKRWRTVIYHTPRLWATLHISAPTPPQLSKDLDPQKRADLTTTFQQRVSEHQNQIIAWLSRSKACALSISIHNPNMSWSISSDNLSYFELMVRFAARIYRLEIDVTEKAVSDYLSALPSSSFPRLRALLVKFNRRLRPQAVSQWRNSGLLNIRQLTCLSVLHFPLPFHELHVDWTHLTHLIATGSTGRKLTPSDVLRIFTSCPVLRYCDVCVYSQREVPMVLETFSLPYLHTLIIFSNSIQLDQLFQYADIPSLRTLSYLSSLVPTPEQRSGLLIILSRTNLKLERLKTNIQLFILSDLLETFEMVPCLTHFYHEHQDLSVPSVHPRRPLQNSHPITSNLVTALLGILTPSLHNPLYLRNLQVIHFNLTSSKPHISDRNILHFIQRRMDRAACKSNSGEVAALTEVAFYPLEEKQMDLQAELSEEIAGGLQLDLVYSSPVTSPFVYQEITSWRTYSPLPSLTHSASHTHVAWGEYL